jgi:hypothetical protein
VNTLLLETVRDLYERARREAVAAAKHDPLEPQWAEREMCPYCGEWWRKWNGSKLDGHAACMVPQWFKDDLRKELASRADVSYADVAKALGVSLSVIRSWCTKRR